MESAKLSAKDGKNRQNMGERRDQHKPRLSSAMVLGSDEERGLTKAANTAVGGLVCRLASLVAPTKLMNIEPG